MINVNIWQVGKHGGQKTRISLQRNEEKMLNAISRGPFGHSFQFSFRLKFEHSHLLEYVNFVIIIIKK